MRAVKQSRRFVAFAPGQRSASRRASRRIAQPAFGHCRREVRARPIASTAPLRGPRCALGTAAAIPGGDALADEIAQRRKRPTPVTGVIDNRNASTQLLGNPPRTDVARHDRRFGRPTSLRHPIAIGRCRGPELVHRGPYCQSFRGRLWSRYLTAEAARSGPTRSNRWHWEQDPPFRCRSCQASRSGRRRGGARRRLDR